MASGDFNLRGLRTLAIAAAAAVAVLLVSLVMLSASVDARARKREQHVAAAAFAQLAGDLQDRVGADAHWDAAVQNLDNHFDPAWAQDNFSSPAPKDVTNRLVMVLDSAGRPIFAREHARPVPWTRIAQATNAAADLMQRLRTEERAPRPAKDWIDGRAVVLLQGRPTLLVASLVGADNGIVRARHAQAPAVLYWSDLSTLVLPAIASRVLLNHAAILPGAAAAGQARLALADPAGHIVATLSWAPEHPGTNLLLGALPPLLAVVGALAFAVTLAYRRGAAAARALQASEARAHHLAFHDGLTGLPNRRLFSDRAEQAVSRASRHGGGLAVLMLDMDRFKLINDSFGHPAGDELIREVARRLTSICRAEDTCARLGGDEFVILSMDGNATDAATLAERVILSMAVPVQLGAAIVHTAASIGISIAADGATSATDLLRQADLALYKAKEHARGSYRFFEIEMDHALQNRRALEHELREALADGTIELAYQLQFNEGRPTGTEALARWNHPQRGMISPAFFVPLAEECGLIESLGDFVLRQAFADARQWPSLITAINISAAQFRLPHFLHNLRAVVAESAIDPGRFELEITETVLMIDDGRLHETLSALRAMGFRLVLDDFGTGYSSLSYLGRFPIDRIKIDRSFILGIPEDPAALPIVRAVIALARALHLDVIAEGVETEAQRAALQALGCTAIQGVLLGAPVTAPEIPALLAGRGQSPWPSNYPETSLT